MSEFEFTGGPKPQTTLREWLYEIEYEIAMDFKWRPALDKARFDINRVKYAIQGLCTQSPWALTLLQVADYLTNAAHPYPKSTRDHNLAMARSNLNELRAMRKVIAWQTQLTETAKKAAKPDNERKAR